MTTTEKPIKGYINTHIHCSPPIFKTKNSEYARLSFNFVYKSHSKLISQNVVAYGSVAHSIMEAINNSNTKGFSLEGRFLQLNKGSLLVIKNALPHYVISVELQALSVVKNNNGFSTITAISPHNTSNTYLFTIPDEQLPVIQDNHLFAIKAETLGVSKENQAILLDAWKLAPSLSQLHERNRPSLPSTERGF